MDPFHQLFAESYAASASLWAARVDDSFTSGQFVREREPQPEAPPWGHGPVLDLPSSWYQGGEPPAWGALAA